MNLQALSSHPILKKLVRECDKGDLLFSQGDPANTVFLVLEGSLELVQNMQSSKVLLGSVNSGEFFGERALLQEEPFNRKASAIATSRTFLLELGPHQFSQLEKEAPAIYLLLLKKAFKTLISRNEALEQYAEALKPFDPKKRFLNYLKLQTTSQASEGESLNLYLEPGHLAAHLNCIEDDCKGWIEVLVQAQVIRASNKPHFFLVDSQRLQRIEIDELENSLAA